MAIFFQVAQDFAEELFHRVRRAGIRTGPGGGGSPTRANNVKDAHQREVVNSACLRNSLALLKLPVPAKGEITIAPNTQTDALALIDQHMHVLERCADDLRRVLREQASSYPFFILLHICSCVVGMFCEHHTGLVAGQRGERARRGAL